MRNTMPDKEFKTIEEQINILNKRGLKINNETETADFLKYNNRNRYTERNSIEFQFNS